MSRICDVILFDLGGVLVELGPSPLPTTLLPRERRGELERWFTSETALAFERGLVSSESFARSLVEELGLDCSEAEVIEHFRRWPRGLYAGAERLLARLKRDYRLAVLSNTNALHWPRLVDEFGLRRQVERIFASHRLAMAKPEAAIFDYVAERLQTPPTRILFFDDSPDNVESARVCGLQAHRVAGFAELCAALHGLGIAPD